MTTINSLLVFGIVNKFCNSAKEIWSRSKEEQKQKDELQKITVGKYLRLSTDQSQLDYTALP